MTTLNAVLFDMDDTLIDWQNWQGNWRELEERHLRHVYQFLQGQGYPPESSFPEFQIEFGRRTQDAWLSARSTLRAPHIGEILMETLRACGFDDDAADVSMRDCLEAYQWQTIPGVTVFPEVIDVLTTLRDRGVTVGIITNAFQPMFMRDVELATYGLLEFFPDERLRISAADAGVLKPHPAIFKRALDVLNVPAESVVFIGDSAAADIEGAKKVGMRAVLRVRDGGYTRLKALADPDLVLNTLTDLLPRLDEWYPGW